MCCYCVLFCHCTLIKIALLLFYFIAFSLFNFKSNKWPSSLYKRFELYVCQKKCSWFMFYNDAKKSFWLILNFVNCYSCRSRILMLLLNEQKPHRKLNGTLFYAFFNNFSYDLNRFVYNENLNSIYTQREISLERKCYCFSYFPSVYCLVKFSG